MFIFPEGRYYYYDCEVDSLVRNKIQDGNGGALIVFESGCRV